MNYYELLGVEKTASTEEIKKAYKTQMKIWHPDVNKDEHAVSISKKLNEAKDILLDENKRKEYDVFLENKETMAYQKYSNVKQKESQVTKEEYQTKMVTKWEYLRDYLKMRNIKLSRRIIALIFVLLESLLCFLLKCLVIGLSILCYLLSDMIIMIFRYLFPIVVLLLVYLIYIFSTDGYNQMIQYHMSEVRGVIILLSIYTSSFAFTFIGKKLISQKVFDLLYNKLDVYLFKKAVGYKEQKIK